MTEERFFSDEELHLMGIRRSDRAIAAIEANDKAKAVREVKALDKEFASMHGLLVSWIASIYSFILEEYGDQALYKVNHKSTSFWLKRLIRKFSEVPLRRKVEMLTSGLRGHLVPLGVDEDHEKFTITMHPCGSGGMLASQGGDRSKNLANVHKAQPQTFSKENFPVYCTHCALQEIISIEEIGHPVFVTDCPEGKNIGKEFCKIYIYKDAANIPQKFYKRLGKKKK